MGLTLHLNHANYREVIQKGANVLVYFHARWCFFCHAFSKTWLDLVSSLESELTAGSLILGDYDTYVEEMPEGINTLQLPALMFYKAVDGQTVEEPIKYFGAHTLDDVTVFLGQNMGVQLSHTLTREDL